MGEFSAEKIRIADFLIACGNEEEFAFAQSLPIVVVELRRIADNIMHRAKGIYSPQVLAPADKGYLKLIDLRKNHWRNRFQLFALSIRIMRCFLFNCVLDCPTRKRGAEYPKFGRTVILTKKLPAELVAPDEALKNLPILIKLKAALSNCVIVPA